MYGQQVLLCGLVPDRKLWNIPGQPDANDPYPKPSMLPSVYSRNYLNNGLIQNSPFPLPTKSSFWEWVPAVQLTLNVEKLRVRNLFPSRYLEE